MFLYAINNSNSENWYDAMKKKIKSMEQNSIWNLLDFLIIVNKVFF